MDSGSLTSSGDGGSGLEAMAVCVWLAWGSGVLYNRDREKARPAPETREAKFQFRFPGGSSLFPAEPPPLLLCSLPGPSPDKCTPEQTPLSSLQGTLEVFLL